GEGVAVKVYGRERLLHIGKSVLSQSKTYRVPYIAWKTITELNLETVLRTKRGSKAGKKLKLVNSENTCTYEHTCTRSQLTGATLNCRSVCNKAISVNDYIVEKHIDFIGLTETWLKDDNSVAKAELVPPGFSLENKSRPGSRKGGGVAIIHKDTLKAKQTATLDFKSFEYIDRTLSCASIHLRIIVLYRPPSSSLAEFLEEFSSLLEFVVVSPGKLVILGDFNIQFGNRQDCYANQFVDVINSFDLIQHVSKPTHTSGHILDLLITRSHEKLAHVCIDEPSFTDHHSVCFKLDQSKPPLPSKVIHYRKLKAIAKDRFIDDIRSSVLISENYDDVDELANA
ncbi:MAG: hypothetical protein L7S42_05020, partial [Flavobacteriaceae bacterium]|nr:hypothetical protein [Flavobacteriaceae bacterium]